MGQTEYCGPSWQRGRSLSCPSAHPRVATPPLGVSKWQLKSQPTAEYSEVTPTCSRKSGEARLFVDVCGMIVEGPGTSENAQHPWYKFGASGEDMVKRWRKIWNLLKYDGINGLTESFRPIFCSCEFDGKYFHGDCWIARLHCSWTDLGSWTASFARETLKLEQRIALLWAGAKGSSRRLSHWPWPHQGPRELCAAE